MKQPQRDLQSRHSRNLTQGKPTVRSLSLLESVGLHAVCMVLGALTFFSIGFFPRGLWCVPFVLYSAAVCFGMGCSRHIVTKLTFAPWGFCLFLFAAFGAIATTFAWFPMSH